MVRGMALMQLDVKSQTLGLASSVHVVSNQAARVAAGPSKPSPVLYLLHGLSDDHSAWLRKTSIERYAERYDLTIVMPAAQRSFYTNTYSGSRYFDFIADELPEICQAYLPISRQREETFVAGVSMGGYGAFKLALSRPQQVAAAASLSGALDLRSLIDQRDELLPEWNAIFGTDEEFRGGENDLVALAERLATARFSKPALYQWCGAEDYMLAAGRSFLRSCRDIGMEVDYREGPGDHSWTSWDREIQEVLRWLPIEPIDQETTKTPKDSTEGPKTLS